MDDLASAKIAGEPRILRARERARGPEDGGPAIE
jgi:hypothetical protein